MTKVLSVLAPAASAGELVQNLKDVEGVEPSDPTDWSLLVETLRPNPRPGDVDLIVGMRGPLAPPEMCNGLTVPIVAFDQLYSFDRDSLIASIPRPEAVPAERFADAAAEVFDRIMQMTDNAGATDEHRALNYLTVRYPAIYGGVAGAHAGNLSLTAVDVRPSALSAVRNIVEVIFSSESVKYSAVRSEPAGVLVCTSYSSMAVSSP